MKITLALLVQRIFRALGFHLRRLDKGVSLDSSLEEQLRLAGPELNVIVEIGAADGRDTEIYVTRCASARVFAYEPLPESFAELKKRADNHPRITAINAAVSNTSGQAVFHVTSLADSSSLKAPKQSLGSYDKYLTEKSTISVDMVRLDEEMARFSIEKIDLLKMDAQGGELDIIDGFAEFLQRKAVRVVYSEVCFMRLYENAPLYHDIASRLEGFGYRLHALYNTVTDRDGRLAWGDAIFVPDNP